MSEEFIKAQQAEKFRRIAEELALLKAHPTLANEKKFLLDQIKRKMEILAYHESEVAEQKADLAELAQRCVAMEQKGVQFLDAPFTLVHAAKIVDEKRLLTIPENQQYEIKKLVTDLGATRQNLRRFLPADKLIYKPAEARIQKERASDD